MPVLPAYLIFLEALHIFIMKCYYVTSYYQLPPSEHFTLLIHLQLKRHEQHVLTSN